MITGLNHGCVFRRCPIRNTAMPLLLFLPLLLRIFITFGGGDRDFRHVSAILRRAAARIFSCEACECYAIDTHKTLFLSEIEFWVSLITNTPA
jgi:hypothetical protein